MTSLLRCGTSSAGLYVTSEPAANYSYEHINPPHIKLDCKYAIEIVP